MKKLLLCLTMVVLVASVFAGTAFAGDAAPFVPKLVTGQQEIHGLVYLWTDGETLYVVFWVNAYENYCLQETHLHIDTDLANIPQNDGGAIPGQFEYKDDWDCVNKVVYKIPLATEGVAVGDRVYIAAHAVVQYPDGTEETGWAVNCGDLENHQFPGSNWSAYIEWDHMWISDPPPFPIWPE